MGDTDTVFGTGLIGTCFEIELPPNKKRENAEMDKICQICGF